MNSGQHGSDTTGRGNIISYLELMRPANIVTAFADIIAGFAAAGGAILIGGDTLEVTPNAPDLAWLLLSTFGLYGGGVVFNDLFDAELDARERPERPIPSGRVSKTGAVLLGSLLLAAGVYFAARVNMTSGTIALVIAVLTIVYDKWAKHHLFSGPVVMGSCRGGNLLLGVSILPTALLNVWFLAFIPVAYIGAITLVSRGEVHGGSKAAGGFSVLLILLVLVGLLSLSLRADYDIMQTLPFVLLFGVMVLPPFLRAARRPEPDLIRTAIKRGVLSLILLNSALASGFAGITLGVLVLLLLPISLLLSKLFSVT